MSTMTDAQIRLWIDACNHEPSRQVLRDFIRLRGEAQAEQAVQCEYPGCGRPAGHPCAYSKCQNLEPEQPAAPAPVAGDAVANLPEKFRNKADSLKFSGTWPGDYVADFVRDCADALEAALAQDRASQAGAAGVPEGLRERLAKQIGFHSATFTLFREELQWLESVLAAAPTPAADTSTNESWIARAESKLATQPPAVGVDAPSVEAAHAMGASGGTASDAERLAFEAWMRGHCWALCATWNGTGYVSDAEQDGGYCPHASNTRRLWAAWRDRAALHAALRTGGGA